MLSRGIRREDVCELALVYIFGPHCSRLYSQSDIRTSVELSGFRSGQLVEDVGLCSSFAAPIVSSRKTITARVRSESEPVPPTSRRATLPCFVAITG